MAPGRDADSSLNEILATFAPLDPAVRGETAVETPSVGRIVHVRLSADCAATIGGNARAGDLVPAIVVRVWSPDCVNARILGDGPGEALWSTSLMRGQDLGQWDWPERV